MLDNLLKHIFINKASKGIDVNLDPYRITNWSFGSVSKITCTGFRWWGIRDNLFTAISSSERASGRKIVTVRLRKAFTITFSLTTVSQFTFCTSILAIDSRSVIVPFRQWLAILRIFALRGVFIVRAVF